MLVVFQETDLTRESRLTYIINMDKEFYIQKEKTWHVSDYLIKEC